MVGALFFALFGIAWGWTAQSEMIIFDGLYSFISLALTMLSLYINNFIAKTKQVKNSLITGANAGAFSLLLKQIVTELDAPLILVEEN